jgi:HYR domain-containing protein/Big-like domain-containing protein
MYSIGCLFPGASPRRWLLKLLPVLAFILISTTTWAAGQKVGQVSVTGQNPHPVNPGGTATFLLTLTRNNNNGSTGSFVANLTYSPVTPGVSYDPSTPTSISYTPKESSKGFFLKLLVAPTVLPGTYPFTVTATRSGTTKDTQSTIAYLIVGYHQVGPIAVDDPGYFTSGLPITIPVLADDIPDPNIVPAQPLYITQIQGFPVKVGGTVVLTNASVTLNADQTLTYTPAANLVPGADQFTYTMTEVGDDTLTNNHACTALVTVTVGTFPRVTLNSELVVTCGPSYTLTATGAGGFPPYTYTWTDASNNVLRTSSPTNGTDSYTVTAPGSYAVTVMDSTGNISAPDQSTVSFDTTGPTINCPANIIQAADPGLCSAAINPGTATATDDCSTPTVSGSRSDGLSLTTPYPVGTTTITWTALDGSGRMATCQQTVTVVDSQAPSITCPPDVTVSTDKGQCTASNVALGTPTASDNCGAPTVSGARSDGLPLTGPFPKGTTTVTWTATDSSGNKATCTQKVTVNDTEKPVLTCPPAVTVSNDAGQCQATLKTTPAASATDNCPGVTVSGSRSDSKALSDPYPVGTTTITWTATDASANTATCTQTVTVNDTEKPVLTCPSAVTVSNDAGQCQATLKTTPSATATDNCPGVSVSGSRSDGKALTDPYPVGATTITWTATDTAGNSASCSQTVTVKDTEAPKISCPGDISVCMPLGQSTAAVTFPNATVTDNCAGASFVGYDIKSGSPFPLGPTVVTGTATDAAGNTATCHFTVTVLANLAVTITPSDSCTPVMTLTASSGASYAWTGPDGSSAGTTQSISATTAGTYSVVVTDATGCQGSASITLEAVLRVKP